MDAAAAANSCEKYADSITRLSIIPQSDTEITAEWFQDVTGIQIHAPSTFRILPNSNARAGNLSRMVRVGFVDANDCRQSFMVKLLPVVATDGSGAELLDIITSENMHGREVFFYANLKTHLGRLVPELRPYFVNCAASVVTPQGSLLILQDLSPDGYEMPTFSDGLSQRHFNQSLNCISKLHVAGELLQREHGDGSALPQVYPVLDGWHVPRSSGSLFGEFKSLTWFPEGLLFVAKHLLGNSPVVAQALLALIPHAENILRCLAAAGSKFPTVIHDDLWPHNFLCQGGARGELKVIDWQLLGFADPCYDLAPLLLSSLPIGDLDRYKLTESLKSYYRSKAKLYAQRALELDRSWTDLESFFNSWGLAYALVWFAMSADSIYATEAYRPKLERIFELLWEASIPQFLIENAS